MWEPILGYIKLIKAEGRDGRREGQEERRGRGKGERERRSQRRREVVREGWEQRKGKKGKI